jgi:hypothetical protein
MAKKDTKFEKVEKLITIFKPERYSYMAISVISCATLISVALYSFISGDLDVYKFIALFLPAGAITFSIGRIMKMWNDVIKILFNTNTDTDNGK